MLTLSDLIHLPYTPGLSDGGIAYTCRSLAYTYGRKGSSRVESLRHTVAEVAVELALRHYLTEQAVPFDVLAAAPFTRPDHYDIALGRHRCEVKSYLITHRSQISQIRRDPGILLQVPALVPLDEFASGERKPDDLYLFVFLLGVVAAGQADMQKAVAAGQPVYLIHLLPEAWTRPAKWLPLEKLVLKSECESPITVEIGGQDNERNFISATLELLPRQRMLVEVTFQSLAYIHADRRPTARIGIYSPVHGEPYLIPAHTWGNLWVYGMDILLTGWLTYADFRRKARVLSAGMRTFLYDRTGVKNLFVPCEQLNPLGPLFKRVKEWTMTGIPAGG